MSENILENLQASLLNFSKRFAEGMRLAGVSPNISVVDFDSVQDEDELENIDLTGPSNLQASLDEHLLEVEVMFGVTTYNDLNTFRLKKLSGYLLEELKPTRTLPYLDATTGVQGSYMVIQNGTKMMPVTGGDRPARFFIVRMKLALGFDLRNPAAA